MTCTTRMLTAFLNLVASLTVARLPRRLHRHEKQIPFRLNLAAEETADRLAEAA